MPTVADPNDYEAVANPNDYEVVAQPAPVAPIIPRSGAQMESLAAREFLATPESTVAGDIRGTGDQPVIPIPRIPQQEGVVAQLGAGAVNAAANLAETFETPQLIASLPVMPMKLTQLLFGGQALSDIKTAYEEAARPETTIQKGLELGGRALTDALFGVGMVHGAVGGLAEPRSLTPKPDGLTESLSGKPEVQPEQSQLLEKVNEGLAAGEQPPVSQETEAATAQHLNKITDPAELIKNYAYDDETRGLIDQKLASRTPAAETPTTVTFRAPSVEVKGRTFIGETHANAAENAQKAGFTVDDIWAENPDLNRWADGVTRSDVQKGEFTKEPPPVSEGGAGTQALISKKESSVETPPTVSQTTPEGQATIDTGSKPVAEQFPTKTGAQIGDLYHGTTKKITDGKAKTAKGDGTISHGVFGKLNVVGTVFDGFFAAKEKKYAGNYSAGKEENIHRVTLAPDTKVLSLPDIVSEEVLTSRGWGRAKELTSLPQPTKPFPFQQDFENYAFDRLNKERVANGKEIFSRDQFENRTKGEWNPTEKDYDISGLAAKYLPDYIKSKGFDAIEMGREVVALNPDKVSFADTGAPPVAPPVSESGLELQAPVSQEAKTPTEIGSGVAPTEAGQPEPPSGVTALTPDSRPPEVGPNVKGFEKVYGPGEIKAGDSVTPEEIFRSGQADLASGKDPYAIADRARTGDVSPKEIGLLSAEHDRLLHEAAAAEGTPDYEAKYQQAKDFAQNMLKPAGTKWHQTGMGLQVKAPIDLSSLTGFRAAFEERFGKEMTPDQANSFSQIAKYVARAKAEDAVELGRTAERVRQRFKGVKDISFEDAVKSLHDEIAKKLKDCNL